MHRKDFLKNTALCAIAVSTTGFIHFNGKKYIGDCETTSDILGPFYRPGSPVRSDLTVTSEKGQILELSGTVAHDDCITPYPNVKLELWHCDSNGVYDNDSEHFLYRGTTYSDANGFYIFRTILPPSYSVGNGQMRPAHFHLMVTGEGYQPLITQLYFSGDPHIDNDKYASSPAAKNRILNVSEAHSIKKLRYNISLSKKLIIERASLDKLVGTYTDEKNKNIQVDFFEKDNLLWIKNEIYGENFEYLGNNTFQSPGMPPGMYSTLHFELMPSGKIKVTYRFNDEDLADHIYTAVKEN